MRNIMADTVKANCVRVGWLDALCHELVFSSALGAHSSSLYV